ncbi:MAG TPA: hypothetical protein VGM39_16830 [Kofleriaceae bacterium]|jgi:hypothetical protein
MYRPTIALALALAIAGCASVKTARVQPDAVYAGPHLRPIAMVHAQVTCGYILFIPLGGEVSLDRVVNRMLLAAAKSMGADKVVNIQVDITPDDGIWSLRKLLGWRSAQASGLAVKVEDDTLPAYPAGAAPGSNSP